MNTALKVVEPPILVGSLSDDELVSILVNTFVKIQNSLPYILELRRRFDEDVPRGKANIGGCKTWYEICEKHLHRAPSTIRHALRETNPASKGGIETTCDFCPEVFPSKTRCGKHEREQRPREWEAKMSAPPPTPAEDAPPIPPTPLQISHIEKRVRVMTANIPTSRWAMSLYSVKENHSTASTLWIP